MQNSPVKNLRKVLLFEYWYRLDRIKYDFQLNNVRWETHPRQVYDRGNGATILLYNRSKGKVILTRQFRLPTYLNGNHTGLLVETCAGLLDKDNPAVCNRKETEQENGNSVISVHKIFEAHLSPG